MSIDKTISCKTAKEFVQTLDPSNDLWSTGSNNWRMDWIFRGQSELPSYRLIPKAFRQHNEGAGRDMTFARERAVKRTVLRNPSSNAKKLLSASYGSSNVDAWLTQLYAEITNLRDYVYFAKTLNFGVGWPDLTKFPVFGTDFVNLYISKLTDQSYMAQLWGVPAFAIGQHHGLSTRLLDWTRNPLFAAFFAVNNLPKTLPEGTELAVYAIYDLLPDERIRIIEVDRAASPYIAAQDGVFTLDTLADSDFLQTGTWPSLDEAYLGQIWKVTLPCTEAGDLVRILWRKQVTIAHMMPVIDNILDALMNKWRWQYPDMDF